MFNKYLPIEYLCIDIANAFGSDKLTGFKGDKELFEARIQWVKDNEKVLEQRKDEAEEPYLYIKAVMALRDVQQGKKTGHLVMLDAACSGLQIMSALSRCIKGGEITCIVDPNKRSDAYTEINDEMNNQLQIHGMGNIVIQRSDAKQATMTAFYGSKKEPLKIFGDTLVNYFYDSCVIKAPGASTLLDDLINAWNKYALNHSWVLPDGFVANINVMKTVEKRIEVDELGGYQFDTKYKINEGAERGVSLAANVIHSIDAYLLRSVCRRCNYQPNSIKKALAIINHRLENYTKCSNKYSHWRNLYESTNMVDIKTLYAIDEVTVNDLTKDHLNKLLVLGSNLLQHKPFPVMTVHDAFRVHPNNCNQLRYWYKEVLAELSESTLIDSILSKLYKKQIKYLKLSNKLPNLIRNSNYAIS